MKRLAIAGLLALGLVPARAAHAQQYRFSVPEAEVTVTIEREGSALIHYKLTFACQRGAHPIDVVDIGMPTSRHEAVGAAIGGLGLPRSSIRRSEYISNGYEVHLGTGTIRPGGTGVFEFTGRSRGMVWQDTTNPEQASFRFTPIWFGERFVVGQTKLVLRYRLPIPKEDYPKVKDRILWQKKGQPFSAKGVMEGEAVASVAWVRTVRLTGRNVFGVSFPKRYVTKVRRDTLWSIFYRWWKGAKEVQTISGLILLVAFGILFFTATRGTGWSVFIVLTILLVLGMVKSPAFHLWLYPILLGLGLLVYWSRRRRRRHYFPAEVCREGGGVKRGLTAVEAAVLLEVPLHKVLTMVIFGLAKKGVVKVASKERLRLEVCGQGLWKEAEAASRKSSVWQLPDGKKLKLWPYERDFVEVFWAHGKEPVERMHLDKPFDRLIRHVVSAMKGFDLDATREYYKYVIARAWRQVEAEADFEARYKRADRALGWLMLDEDWGRSLDDLGRGRHGYFPWWWYGGDYGTYTVGSARGGGLFGGGGGGGGSAPAPTAPETSFGDVANSLVGRMENVGEGLAGGLDSLARTSSGGIDLSAFDSFTVDTLKTMAESGGSGGGGGFGGCACAGCACACACAGGGR